MRTVISASVKQQRRRLMQEILVLMEESEGEFGEEKNTE